MIRVLAFLALALALVLVQLSVPYPGEYYPLFALLASSLFLQARIGPFHTRALILSSVLLIAWAQVRTLSSAYSSVSCEGDEFRGFVREIYRKKDKQLLIESDDGISGLVRVVDLPWLDSGEVTRGARVGVKTKRCSPVLTLSREPPWSYQWYLRKLGAVFVADATELEILWNGREPLPVERIVRGVFERLPDSDGLSVLVAATLGRGELLSSQIQELFRNTATTHLLVVSGFHLSVVARGAGGLLLQLAKSLRPQLFLYLPAPLILVLSAAVSGIIYGWLIGFSMTVSRSLVALGFCSLLTLLTRKVSPYLAIVYAFIVVQLLFPLSIFEPGCQLTFSALIGLPLGGRLSRYFEERLFPAEDLAVQLEAYSVKANRVVFNVIWKPLLECFPVSLTTSCVILLWFEQLVPLAAAINALLIPIFSLLVISVGGGALLIFALSGISFPLELATDLTGLVIKLLATVDRLLAGTNLGAIEAKPTAGIWVLCLQLGLFLLLWRRVAKVS